MNHSEKIITQLQSDNKRLSEDLKSLGRNYEALCLKIKEDKNLMKRLEDELSLSNSKAAKDEMEKAIQGYKEKISQLASALSTLEMKYHNASQNCIRYQENEVKYKARISRLEGLLKEKDKSDSLLSNTRRVKEEESTLYAQENAKLNEYNIQLKSRLNEMNKTVNETNLAHEQLKKENEMIYRLLEESRVKIKKSQEMMEELTVLLKDKQQSEAQNQKIIEGCNATIESLKRQITALQKEHCGMSSYPSLEVCRTDTINVSTNEDNAAVYIKALNYANLSSYENRITDKIAQIEQRHCDKLTKLKALITSLNQKYTSNLLNIKKKRDEVNRKQKEQYDLYLKTKKSKVAKLKADISTLNEIISKNKEKEKNTVDLSEIRTLFNQINQIIERLKLTMETFSINLKCKNCFKEKPKLIQLKCGHSVCFDCIKSIKECIECFIKISSLSDLTENLSYNSIIARYKYAQQQIEGDIELVIASLKFYLIQK